MGTPNWAGWESWQFDTGRARTSTDIVYDYRGQYPETWYNNVGTTNNATNTDNLVIYTSGDVSMYNCTQIYVTTGSVSVQASLDGTTYTGDLALIDLQSTTPATRVLTTSGTNSYRLDGKWKSIKVLQNGVGAAANATIVHSVM
jgi:hypothetical protein